MMKTWLIRRAVRRPVADAVTARISSSVCRLPFIRSSPLPARISSTRLRGRRLAVRRVDDFDTCRCRDCACVRTAAIFAAGPTRIGMMMPASAASITPRSEVSSQGCTTIGRRRRNLLRPRNQPLVFGVRHGTCSAACAQTLPSAAIWP